MKILTIFIILLCMPVLSDAKELQLFNILILGKTIDTDVKLLNDMTSDKTQPYSIMIDIRNNKFAGATVQYVEEMTFVEARNYLNKEYHDFKLIEYKDNDPLCIWKSSKKNLSIQMIKNEFGIQVCYVTPLLLYEKE